MDRLTLNTDYLRIFGRSIVLAAMTTGLTLADRIPDGAVDGVSAAEPADLVFIVTVPFWTNLLVRNYAWILLLRDGGDNRLSFAEARPHEWSR